MTRFEWTAEAFEEAGEAGVIPQHADLIEGTVYLMAPQSDAHAHAIRVLTHASRRMPDDYERYFVGIQQPVRLADNTEPEPDLWVARGPDHKRHPFGSELELVVETSLNSLGHDLGPKLDAYARYLVPTVWVVNLFNRQLHLYTANEGGVYTVQSVEQILTHACGLTLRASDFW